MKVKFVFDSTIVYDEKEKKAADVEITPFIIMAEGKSYLDLVNITPLEVYNMLEAGIDVKTSQPNISSTIELFKELLEEYDHIMYFTLPEELSGTYNAGVLAAKEVDEKRITVIDIKCGLSANQNLARKAQAMLKEGKSLKEIEEKALEIKDNSHFYFIPDGMGFLAKSGRVSNMAAGFFNLIKLKIALDLKLTGWVDKFDVSRTENNLYKAIVKDAKKQGFTAENSMVYIIDTNIPEKCEELKVKLQKDFPGIEMVDQYLSPTIGTHTGPRAYGMQFVKKDW